MLFYSGRQFSLWHLSRGSCCSRQFPPSLKSIHTAHHPLNDTRYAQTHALSHTDTQCVRGFSVISFLLYYFLKLCALKFIQPTVTHTHTHNTSITVTVLRKNLSISSTRHDSIYNTLPIRRSAYALPFSLFTTPHKFSKSFYWQTTPWRPQRILNAVRKGHDIQKWHSLWGNGSDVWPLNKVSSIGSMSKLLGIFGIAGPSVILKAFSSTWSIVSTCATLSRSY